MADSLGETSGCVLRRRRHGLFSRGRASGSGSALRPNASFLHFIAPQYRGCQGVTASASRRNPHFVVPGKRSFRPIRSTRIRRMVSLRHRQRPPSGCLSPASRCACGPPRRRGGRIRRFCGPGRRQPRPALGGWDARTCTAQGGASASGGPCG